MDPYVLWNGRKYGLMQVSKPNIDPLNPSHGCFCRSFDYAYAVNDCLSLAKGTFIRDPSRYPMPKKGPLCPDSSNKAVEGVCNPEFSQTNADSITLISTGKS